MIEPNTHSPPDCQALCISELAAAESYKFLLSKFGFGEDDRLKRLADVHSNHERSFSDLNSVVREPVDAERRQSLLWTEVVEWSVMHPELFASSDVIDLLLARETECEAACRGALENEDTAPDIVDYIKDVLLARATENIGILLMIQKAARAAANPGLH